MTYRVIDIETTGTDPEKDRICEIAFVDVWDTSRYGNIFGKHWSSLVNPGIPMPPEASAVHHIIDEDVKSAPSFDEVVDEVFGPGTEVEVFVAHNAKFDSSFLPEQPAWICTYKCALRVWPEFEKHSNQYLRYRLNLPVPRDVEVHRALGDATVTAYLLVELLKHATHEQMIEWSKEPPLFTILSFGKHKGERWEDLPDDYLTWIVEKSDLDEDVKWNAFRHIKQRGYLTLMTGIMNINCHSRQHLEEQFGNDDEKKKRVELGITRDSKVGRTLLDAYTARWFDLKPSEQAA